MEARPTYGDEVMTDQRLKELREKCITSQITNKEALEVIEEFALLRSAIKGKVDDLHNKAQAFAHREGINE